VLLDWCRQTTAGDSTGLAVVTGIGGSGKTRLALELANRLRREGWYAGTLPKGAAGVDRLAGVVSPVLVILDYADGRVTDATALLAALRTRRESPAVVLLTARAVDGDWLANIVEALDSDAHPYRTEPVALPDTHPGLRRRLPPHSCRAHHRGGATAPATARNPVDHPGLRAAGLGRLPGSPDAAHHPR
jgi:CheY-like chemotaxis protein